MKLFRRSTPSAYAKLVSFLPEMTDKDLQDLMDAAYYHLGDRSTQPPRPMPSREVRMMMRLTNLLSDAEVERLMWRTDKEAESRGLTLRLAPEPVS